MGKCKVTILKLPVFLICILMSFPSLFYGQHPIAPVNEYLVFTQDSIVADTTLMIAAQWIKVDRNVRIENYFKYLDSLVSSVDPQGKNTLNEHYMVHQNSWILDTLCATDYYVKKLKDSFIFDQKKCSF